MTHLSQHWRQNWCMQVMWTGSSASRKMHMQMLHSTSAEGLLAWEGLGRGLARLSCTCGFSLKSDPGGVTPHLWQHATGSSIQASSKVSLDHSAERYTLRAWNCTLGIIQHFSRDFTFNQCTPMTTFFNSTLSSQRISYTWKQHIFCTISKTSYAFQFSSQTNFPDLEKKARQPSPTFPKDYTIPWTLPLELPWPCKTWVLYYSY